MKKLVLLFGVASLLSLSSCDLVMLGNGTIGRETPRIERGMTQEQVYSLLGRPTYRQIAEDGIEEWEYHRSGLLEKRITIIVFAAGRVIRMNTYGEEYGRTEGSRYPRQERRYPPNETAIPMIIADMEATTSTKMLVVKKRMNDGSIRCIEKYKTSFSPMIS